MRTRSREVALLFCMATCAACASSPRFKDATPVWRVDDTRTIAEPEERHYDEKEYFANIFVLERLQRTLELRDLELAHNVNALEEVPDSSWFENRIGARRISPAEAARGFDAGGPPRPPFTVTSGKVGGGNPGFMMKDGTGRKFLVKFDTLLNPEQQTAAGIIVNRIMWTSGYYVPSDHVFGFRREELKIEPGARYTNEEKDKLPFDDAELDTILATSPRRADGGYRALASQLLPGKPKGGFAADGVRSDDANDRIRHEHRRELRGLRVIAAWVSHTDMKDDNTLDMYVERDGRKYLQHYFLDFGEALDGHGSEKGRREDGWEHFIDWEMQTKATFAFGLWKRPWENVKSTRWPSVGAFTADPFDPRAWQEAYPYWPFAEMDDSDAYWAAKLVMRFDRPMLEAIVAQGQFSEPDAAHYVVDTLVARRDAIGRAFFDAVSPLDEFRLEPERLCMTDLAVRYGFAPPSDVEWLSGSRVLTTRRVDATGRLCVRPPRSEAYTVFRLRVKRADGTRPAMELHFVPGPKARLLGLVRVAD